MGKTRLEAFSDGVLAIIITIMVLELKVPEDIELAALRPLLGVFLSYILSFIYIGIYWNNHHHLIHTVERVSGGVMWANLHLLFWLSLVPFATAWMGEHNFAPQPTAVYGVVLIMAAIAYKLLYGCIVSTHGPDSVLKRATSGDWKPNTSTALYAIGIVVAWREPAVAGLLYLFVAIMWLVPNRRIERALSSHQR